MYALCMRFLLLCVSQIRTKYTEQRRLKEMIHWTTLNHPHIRHGICWTTWTFLSLRECFVNYLTFKIMFVIDFVYVGASNPWCSHQSKTAIRSTNQFGNLECEKLNIYCVFSVFCVSLDNQNWLLIDWLVTIAVWIYRYRMPITNIIIASNSIALESTDWIFSPVSVFCQLHRSRFFVRTNTRYL